MKRLVALCECYHNGTHRTGESFVADSDQDAMILVAIGNARYEDAPPQPAPQPVQTRAMKAEDKTPAPAAPMNTQDASDLVPPKPLKKGKYKRRDMRAED
jgi:hypothetical protein